MSASATTGKYIEGMRLTERERGLLIEQMKKSGIVDRRKNPRHILDGNLSLLLTMDSPGGASSNFRIYPWDISREGVGFFHRSFVYPGTRCTFTGLTAEGEAFTIVGDVVRCSHVSGSVHSVGTKLDAAIDPEKLLGPNVVNPATRPDHAAAEDWWSRIGAHAAEIARLAREKAPPEAIRSCVAGMVSHANTRPAPGGHDSRPRAAA